MVCRPERPAYIPSSTRTSPRAAPSPPSHDPHDRAPPPRAREAHPPLGPRTPHGVMPVGCLAPDGRSLFVAVSGSPRAPPGVDESTLPPPDRAADGIAVVDLRARRVARV